MASFPDIGYQLAEGFAVALPDNLIRTPMDVGPAKIRRRTTSNVYQMSVGYVLNSADVTTLEAFYNDTLSGGALSFTMPHPKTLETIECRFTAAPQFAWSDGYYRTTLMLEVLP